MSTINYWPQNICAKAYWSQHELPTYQELLRDTREWLEPQSGQTWLDLGCGGGQLTRALWERTAGTITQVVAMDCAPLNEKAYSQLRQELRPTPRPGQIEFWAADFATGLPRYPNDTFHGVVSGLSIQYADSYDSQSNRWTTEAYDNTLSQIFRILRPGGTFVFSVNVPNPSWSRVGWESFTAIFRTDDPVRFLVDGFRMWKFGTWVKQEAARGRFHYLPIQTISGKLSHFGFVEAEHRLTYAEQAYLIRCRKP
ncbi:MAG: class I SAM-dependent methyltransferase [Gemmataceae bacterium]